jgi:threonine/homoserine/homoserine lactone efflux protein
MTVEAWALFWATELVLCVNPGPATVVVVSQSPTRGRSTGLRVTLGILAANAF